MQFFRYFAVAVLILALVLPTDAFLRRIFRKAKKAVKKVVKKVGKAIRKPLCRALWGIGCKGLVVGAGAALSAGTSGLGSLAVGAGVALGKHACELRKKKCKRSVDTDYVMIPFSDEMSDYDMNNDKRISYPEFASTVFNLVDLKNPDRLLEIFMFSDFNGDGELDTDEFKGAPLLFAHVNKDNDMFALEYESPAAA